MIVVMDDGVREYLMGMGAVRVLEYVSPVLVPVELDQ